MSDYGAFAGAQLISTQLSIDRFMDGLERNREIGALQRNDAAWRNQYNDLVNRYNALLADTNRICKSHDAQNEAMDGTIDALRGTINEIKTREARLIEERDRLQSRYELLLALQKERDPGFEFFEE